MASENLQQLVIRRQIEAGEPEGQREFTARSLLSYDITLEDLTECTLPVGFYKTKAKNILLACERIVNMHDNDVPSELDELLDFQGVGPKIAFLTLSIAWEKDMGICVDTHVHRISNKLRWVQKEKKSIGKSKSKSKSKKDEEEVNTTHSFAFDDFNTASPEKTRMQLEKIIPREKWGQVNNLLVGFGQTVCSAQRPLCGWCSLKGSCAWYQDQDQKKQN